MTAENSRDSQLPDDENNSPKLKRGEALSKEFRAHCQALLAALEKLAHVGEGVIDVSDDDPEFLALKEKQEAKREEMKRTLEEIRNLPSKERTERIKAYLKAYIEAPSLLDQVKARLKAAEQHKRNEELLRQFGQENHTSIN